MDESEETDELGYLGEYGVVIVPPTDDSGAWFVTLASWDDEAEAYGAGTDGPLFGSREEAMEQAAVVLNWLETQKGQGDLTRLWEQMQDQIGAQATDQEFPPSRGPWGRIIR